VKIFRSAACGHLQYNFCNTRKEEKDFTTWT